MGKISATYCVISGTYFVLLGTYSELLGVYFFDKAICFSP